MPDESPCVRTDEEIRAMTHDEWLDFCQENEVDPDVMRGDFADEEEA